MVYLRQVLRYFAVVALAGCYAETGVGVAPGGPTIHGSMGVIVHFGTAASVRAGLGAGMGPYRPATGETGKLTTVPVDVGVEARVIGNAWDSLVVSLDAHPSFTGHIHAPDSDDSEPATTFRGFAGVGYHHDWWQAPKRREPDEPASRVITSITTAVGAELWYGDSSSAARESSTRVGVAMSVMFEVRAWIFLEALACAGKSSSCD